MVCEIPQDEITKDKQGFLSEIKKLNSLMERVCVAAESLVELEEANKQFMNEQMKQYEKDLIPMEFNPVNDPNSD